MALQPSNGLVPAASSAVQHPRASLLGLPGELRNIIYDFVFAFGFEFIGANNIGLRLVCRQIYNEVCVSSFAAAAFSIKRFRSEILAWSCERRAEDYKARYRKEIEYLLPDPVLRAAIKTFLMPTFIKHPGRWCAWPWIYHNELFNLCEAGGFQPTRIIVNYPPMVNVVDGKHFDLSEMTVGRAADRTYWLMNVVVRVRSVKEVWLRWPRELAAEPMFPELKEEAQERNSRGADKPWRPQFELERSKSGGEEQIRLMSVNAGIDVIDVLIRKVEVTSTNPSTWEIFQFPSGAYS